MSLAFNASSLTLPYFFVVLAGTGFWSLCLGAAYINFQFAKKLPAERLHATIEAFFILNAVFTFGQLIWIMIDAGSFNPYTYQGMNQKYFIGTGDLLRGISFDVSTTNSLLNASAVIYFLYRGKSLLLLLCMIAMLLTASNFTNIILLAVMVFIFIFQSTRVQKSLVIVCIGLFAIFMARVSPQNKHYLNYIYQKLSNQRIDTIPPDIGKPLLTSLPDNQLTREERKKKLAMLYLDSMFNKNVSNPVFDSINPQVVLTTAKKPSIPKPNIHTRPYQRLRDTTLQQKQLLEFATQEIPSFDTSLKNTQKQQPPGKWLAFKQTFTYLKEHPERIIVGTGTGRFASKLAFRATGLHLAGGYPKRYAYINDAFRDNHLNLYLNYFSKDMEVHSLANSPDSVYDQLVAEYGLAGLLGFILLYVRYFVIGIRKKNYGLPLVLLIAGAFFAGYWFEQLSIIIIFELMMLTDKKEANLI